MEEFNKLEDNLGGDRMFKYLKQKVEELEQRIQQLELKEVKR
jgi:hypothetical protein